MALFLSTCEICSNSGEFSPIKCGDLDRGLASGCGLCAILSRSITSLQRRASESSGPKLEALRHIGSAWIKPSSTEADLHIGLQIVVQIADAYKMISLPYQIFLDCENSDIPSSFEKFSLVRDVPTKLTLSSVIAYVQRCMTSCNTYHPRCSTPRSPELPKRVLDISSGDGQLIKLLEPPGVHGQYIALSYSWGNTGHMLTTTTANLPQHLHGIPWETLPRTFQDSIVICRALGIRYLWIDALAIVQDDLEDWELESAKMSTIYSNSYLTIAASSCADSHTTIFSDRWTTLPVSQNMHIRTDVGSIAIEHEGRTFRARPKLHLAHDRFKQMDNARAHAVDAPLLTRAWAFQERLLPAKTLHFVGEEMVWECKTDLRCECSEIDDTTIKAAELCPGDAAGQVVQRDFSTSWLKSFFSRVESPTTDHNDLCSIWMDLVSEYSRLDLTHESDRLPALSGLAARFLNTSLGDYIAGMWTQMLPLSLLYMCHWQYSGLSHSRPHDSKPQAPSWSWASNYLAGPKGISYDSAINKFGNPCAKFRVRDVQYKVCGKNPFGGVEDTLLTVQGNCVKCVAVKEANTTMCKMQIRGAHIPPPEDDALAHLFQDDAHSVKHNMKLVFLHLGSGLGLALQRVSGLQEPKCWRRVGMASLPLANLHAWERHMKLSVLHLV